MAESKDNVKVAIRVRPLSEKEKRETGQKVCVNLQPESGTLVIDARPESKTFTFDYVADMNVPQQQIFEMVGKPISSSCMSGYNGTIFAYGQTGAGKTFTIQGPDNDGGIDEYEGSEGFEQRGLMPRCIEHIFSCISAEQHGIYEKEFLVKASFLEIYQEQVIDLLSGVAEGYNLQLREDIKRGVYVDGLIEENVSSAQDTYEILRTGTSNRHVGSTSMNKESSRSHSVFTLTIESKEIRDGVMNFKTSRFHMIDLAGSERQKATDAAGERLREAGMINKSLSALGNVINSLVDIAEGKSRHVHYRDSKLTFLLKDSLGGNSRTFIVANISASVLAFGETLSTLKFAQRAKMIKNKAVINEDTAGSVQLLKEEIRRLKEELINTKEINQLAIEQCPKCAGAIAGPQNTLPSDVSNERLLQLELLLERNTKLRVRDIKAIQEQLEHKEALVQSLQSQIAKLDKRISNDKMVLKFRDATIARLQGQQPANPEDSEIENCRKENSLLREQLETNSSAAKLFMENELLKEELVRLKREVMEDPESLVIRLKENLEFTEQMGDWLNEDITIREKMKGAYDEYLKYKSGELVPDHLKLRNQEEITELKLIYADRISELTDQLHASEAAKRDMETSLHKKMEQQAKRIEELVGDNALLMRKCDETLMTQSRIEDEHSQSEGTVKRLMSEIDNLTSSEAKLRFDLENLSIEHTFLQETNENLAKTSQELNEVISRLETDGKTSSGLISDLRSQNESLSIENAGFKHGKTEDEKAILSLRTEIGELQTTLETRLGELTALGQDLELAQEDNRFIRTQAEELKTRSQDLEDEKQELEKCNEELMQTMREQEEAQSSLEDTVKTLQGEISGLQTQVKDLTTELGLRISELIQTTQDLEEEKRAFLKVREELDGLKNDAEERCRRLTEAIEGEEEESEPLEGESERGKLTFSGENESLRGESEQEKLSFSEKSEQSGGRSEFRRQTFSGGSDRLGGRSEQKKPTLSGGLQGVEHMVSDLRKKLKDKERNIQELMQTTREQEEAHSSLEDTVKTLQGEISGLQTQVKDLKTELSLRISELTQKTQDSEEEKRAFLKVREELDGLKNDAEERYRRLTEAFEGEEEENEPLEGESEREKPSISGENESLRDESGQDKLTFSGESEYTGGRPDLRRQTFSLGSKHSVGRSDEKKPISSGGLQGVELMVSDLRKKLKEKERNIQELTQTTREQEEGHSSLEDTVKTLQGEISGLQTQVKDLQTELGLRISELTQKTQDLEEEKRVFLKVREELDGMKDDAEERCRRLTEAFEGEEEESEPLEGESERGKFTFSGENESLRDESGQEKLAFSEESEQSGGRSELRRQTYSGGSDRLGGRSEQKKPTLSGGLQGVELMVSNLKKKLKEKDSNLQELELQLSSQAESASKIIESLQENLSQEIEKAKIQAQEQSESITHLNQKIETSKTDFFGLSKKLTESEKSKVLLNEQIQRLSEERKTAFKDYESLQFLLENAKTEASELHQKLAFEKDEYRRRIEELESVISIERKTALQEFGQLSLIETERNSLETLTETQKTEINALKSTLQKQETELSSLKADFDHLKAGENAAKLTIAEALEAEEALREENMRLKQSETVLKTNISDKENEFNRLSDALEAAMKDVAGLRIQIQESHVREKGLMHSLSDLTSQLKAIETDTQTQISSHIAARSEEQTRWSGKCEELAQTLKMKERIYEEKIAGLAEHIHVNQQNLEHYQQLLLSAEQKNSDLTCELSQTQENQASVITSHQSRIQELQTELETAHVDIKALKEENKAKLEILQNTNRNILSTRQEIEMWKKCIEEKNESIQHLRHSLRKSEEDRTQLTTQLTASRSVQVPACTHESEIQYLNGVLKRREQELFELKEKGQLYYAQADEAIESQRKEIDMLTKRCTEYQVELGKCKEEADRRRYRSHESSGDVSEAALAEKPKGYRESEAKENDRSPLSHKFKTQPPRTKDDSGILKLQVSRLTEELMSKNEQIEALQQTRSRPKTRTEDEEGLRAHFEAQIESLSAGLNKITEYVFSLPIVSFNPEETGIIESTVKAISSIYEAYEAKCRELQTHAKPARPHPDPAAKYHTEPHQTFGSNYVNPSNFKNPVAHYHALINSSSIKPGEFLSPSHDRRSPGKAKKP